MHWVHKKCSGIGERLQAYTFHLYCKGEIIENNVFLVNDVQQYKFNLLQTLISHPCMKDGSRLSVIIIIKIN